jgi:hypothetical protein
MATKQPLTSPGASGKIETTPFALPNGVILNVGDVFHATGGPRYKCESGRTSNVGEKPGRYSYVGVHTDAIGNVILLGKSLRDGRNANFVISRSDRAASVDSNIEWRPYKIKRTSHEVRKRVEVPASNTEVVH